MSEYLVKLDNATRMLAECKNPIDALAVMALADAAEAWAKTLRLGEEAENYAIDIKCDAKRKLGEMLRSSERAKGGAEPGVGRRGKQCSTKTEPHSDAPTLADLGISKKLSAESQALAKLPENQYQEVKRKQIERRKKVESAEGEEIRSPDYQDPCSPEIKINKDRNPETTDSPNLVGLKRYWRVTSKKDRKTFLTWTKERSAQ